jgi:hypothetical protein
MKKINSFYSVVQIEKLTELSSVTGLTVAEHLRRAVDLYLQENKKCTQEQTSLEKSLGDGQS